MSMGCDSNKLEQVFKHFTVEVMERALGLGNRYTRMDTKSNRKYSNDSMIGSLVPKSIIEEMNNEMKKKINNSEEKKDSDTEQIEEQIDEEEFKTDYSTDSYSFDIYIKKELKGTELKIILKYWTPPKITPLKPYALKGKDGPLDIENSQNWDDKKFKLPFDDPENIGELITDEIILKSNDEIRKQDFNIVSKIHMNQKEKYAYQRITLKAIGSIPLLYPIIEVEIKNLENVETISYIRKKLDEKEGKKIDATYDIWFRSNNCQVIPKYLDTHISQDTKFEDINRSIYGLGTPVKYLFVSPISIFLEYKTISKWTDLFLMNELYNDPFHNLTKIIDIFKQYGFEEYSKRLNQVKEILERDEEALQSLKTVNLVYYNYFKKQDYEKPFWMPFQWTYLLLSFCDILEGKNLENEFDFIGVRTGGGKTEAYVALTLALGFYAIFKGDTPESITLVRFPRRTLVIDQYQRVISILTWANLVLKYLITKEKKLKNYDLTKPFNNFTTALLLGNTTEATIPFSPSRIEDLYPELDKDDKLYRFRREFDPEIGTYGIKGIPGGNEGILRSEDTKDKTVISPERDIQEIERRWTEKNLIQACLKFRTGIDLITPAARFSYPLAECPICKAEIIGRFNYEQLRPSYCCKKDHYILLPNDNSKVEIKDEIEIFMYRTDEELVRYRPSVVLGTLDKLPHVLININEIMRNSFLGCMGNGGFLCTNHGFFIDNEINNIPPKNCVWNESRGLFGGPKNKNYKYKCDQIEHCSGKKFKLIVHDEIHMFDDIVGGLSSPYERIFLKKLDKKIKVLGMSATVSNILDVSKNLLGRKKVNIYPPSFFFEEIQTLNRIHMAGLISIPREKRQFKAMHLYMFQLIQTWLKSKEEMDDNLHRTSENVMFNHPLLDLKSITLTDDEREECLELLFRWIGYVRKKSDGEILYIDLENGLEYGSNNKNHNYPNFGYISGDYPFEDLNIELNKFKNPIRKNSEPRVMITTNIFSVGVDVGKLSLILFHGRPDKISEYVQSSSRVGRGKYPIGISFINFTRADVRSEDIFSSFSRDMLFRYEIIENSHFNAHSIGVIRETILPILQVIMKLQINGINTHTPFTDMKLKNLLSETYFSHLEKHEVKSDFSLNYIEKILVGLEEEYNKVHKLSRYELLSPFKSYSRKPDFRKLKEYDDMWQEIQQRHENLPKPKMMSLRSVGDQIDIFAYRLWRI
jgi:hypothetical protein